MKKVVLLFSIAFLSFTPYPNDEIKIINNDTPILVKEIINYKDDKQYVDKITYNGNKIVSQNNADGFIINYTYTGDLITKIEAFEYKGKPYFTQHYTYVNGKIDTSTFTMHSNFYHKTEIKYTHNADGTVSYNNFTTLPSGEKQPNARGGKYTFNNGNLIKEESLYEGRETVITYEYDTKNNVFRNVLGFNLLLDRITCSVNNVTKLTSKFSDIESMTTTYVYKYDSDDFPKEEIKTDVYETSTYTKKISYRY